MQKVVGFYDKLPRGPAPDPKGKGLLGRYQARYFGKNPSPMREWTLNEHHEVIKMLMLESAALVHVIGGLLILGYGMEYYFHLSK